MAESDLVRLIPSVAHEQCGVFSTHQALLAGWSHDALRHAVGSGRLVRLRSGAYAVADVSGFAPDLNVHEIARWRHAAPGIAAALTTSAVASHSTAAVLRGIPLPYLPRRACVCVVPSWTGRVPKVHLHRCSMPVMPPTALRSNSPERTIVDLAREHGVEFGVVAADYVLHKKVRTERELTRELEVCRGWPAVRAARDAIAFADGRSESVLESRSRLLMQQWGLPQPDLQVRIGNQCGGFVARVDFYWDEFGVVGEADGAIKYDGTDPAPLHEEKKRQEILEQDLELPVVRWGNADLRDFGVVAARLQRRFARRAGLPRASRLWRVLPPL